MSAKRIAICAARFPDRWKRSEREWNSVNEKGRSIFVYQYVRRVMVWLMIIGKSSIIPVMKG